MANRNRRRLQVIQKTNNFAGVDNDNNGALSRKELQAAAKKAGIPANQSSDKLRAALGVK